MLWKLWYLLHRKRIMRVWTRLRFYLIWFLCSVFDCGLSELICMHLYKSFLFFTLEMFLYKILVVGKDVQGLVFTSFRKVKDLDIEERDKKYKNLSKKHSSKYSNSFKKWLKTNKPQITTNNCNLLKTSSKFANKSKK